MNFERGKDPKESLKLGLYQVRHFKDDYEATDWILSKLKTIMNLDGDGLTRWEKLEQYVIKYVIVDDSFPPYRDIGIADPSLMFLIKRKLESNGIRIRIRRG